MSDLIDRQAAIDALMALKAEDDEMYGCSIPESFDGERAVETLRKLPSAQPENKRFIAIAGRRNGKTYFSKQPEVIYCKDCYWWTKQPDSLQGRCARYGFYPTGHWYCAGAKMREEET